MNVDINVKSENLIFIRDLKIAKRKPVQGDKKCICKGFILVE